MTRTDASSQNTRKCVVIPSHMAWLMAFFLCGRLNVNVATPASIDAIKASFSMAG
jgi:hypothetical protein